MISCTAPLISTECVWATRPLLYLCSYFCVRVISTGCFLEGLLHLIDVYNMKRQGEKFHVSDQLLPLLLLHHHHHRSTLAVCGFVLLPTESECDILLALMTTSEDLCLLCNMPFYRRRKYITCDACHTCIRYHSACLQSSDSDPKI